MSITVLITIIAAGAVLFVGYLVVLLKTNNSKTIKSADDTFEDMKLIEQAKDLQLIKEAKPIDTKIMKNELFKKAYQRKQKLELQIEDESKKEDESFNFETVEFGENKVFSSLQEEPEPPEMEEPEIPEPQIKEPETEKKENQNYEDYTPEAWERIKKLQEQIKDIRH
jgi:hypothetical protein